MAGILIVLVLGNLSMHILILRGTYIKWFAYRYPKYFIRKLTA